MQYLFVPAPKWFLPELEVWIGTIYRKFFNFSEYRTKNIRIVIGYFGKISKSIGGLNNRSDSFETHTDINMLRG